MELTAPMACGINLQNGATRFGRMGVKREMEGSASHVMRTPNAGRAGRRDRGRGENERGYLQKGMKVRGGFGMKKTRENSSGRNRYRLIQVFLLALLCAFAMSLSLIHI